MNEFDMPVKLLGAMSFNNDKGESVSRLYVINSDPSNDMYVGFVPASVPCDPVIFSKLSKTASYPIDLVLKVRSKSSGNKITQHAIDIVAKDNKSVKS